jgi:hypothetical protein
MAYRDPTGEVIVGIVRLVAAKVREDDRGGPTLPGVSPTCFGIMTGWCVENSIDSDSIFRYLGTRAVR